MLHIATLGPPEVRIGKHLVVFPTRKTLALLIYLAIEAGAQPRAHLASLLWPEVSPERSYASLRNTLGHLNNAFHKVGDEARNSYLSITNQTLGLNPEAEIDFDLQIVESAYGLARADRSSRATPKGSASQPQLELAVTYQRGDFLAGFSLGDAPDFDDWVAIQREVWHRRLGLILDRLSEIQFASGEFAGATETVARWIALDDLNEIAYRRKMRAHFAAGERGQALDTYEACHAILKAELDIEPEPDTAALAERIRSQRSHTRSLTHDSSPPSKSSDTSVAFLGNLFAGRINEHQSLVDSYARAAANQPQLVVLHGEAGIGKTFLARKFLAWAKSQGAELLHAGNFESGSHIPFLPFIDALRGRLEHENSPQDLLEAMWLSPLSQLLPELRREYPELPPPLLPETNGYQTQFYEPLMQYTLALAKQAPLALFVDDLQWTDSATLGLLQYAIRRWQDRSARVLLLVSLRSEALHPITQPQQINDPRGLGQWLSQLERELSPVQIELKPLGERDTVEMVLSILSPPDADFAQWLYDETRGHPFYLIETLKDLLERQVLRPKKQENGQWVFTLGADHDLGHAVRVPSTVHTIIRARLNRLSPNAFSLLACGAVIEQQITFEHLCDISNLSEDLALPALDELISSRLLLETVRPGTASEFVFTNDMLRDVVYTEAGDARRRLFHRRALEVLEEAQASSAVLAHHAIAAGLDQAAFHHSLTAGQEALSVTAVSEAIIHFKFALKFVQEASQQEIPEESKLRDLYLLLGRAYKLSGQNEKASQMDSEYNKLS